MDNRFTAVARVGRLFGDISSGGVSLSLYTTLPEDFDPAQDALFVEIDSLPVPLYCEEFERLLKLLVVSESDLHSCFLIPVAGRDLLFDEWNDLILL